MAMVTGVLAMLDCQVRSVAAQSLDSRLAEHRDKGKHLRRPITEGIPVHCPHGQGPLYAGR